MGRVDVSVGDVAAVSGPEDVLVRLHVELSSQRLDKRVGVCVRESASVAVSHWQIDLHKLCITRLVSDRHAYLSTVTPHPGRMERQESREYPQLRQDTVGALPGINIQDAKPKFSPGGNADCPAPGQDQLSSSASIFVRSRYSYKINNYRK